MGRLAIMAAMHEELHALLAAMPNEHRTDRGGRTFWCSHWQGHDVVAVLSGIGKVAAATTATLLVSEFQAERIVFTGVAGGLAPGVQVGDVVVARALLQHDMDASPLFPRYEIPGTGRAVLPSDAALSTLAAEAAAHALAQEGGAGTVHTGLIISGDRFVGTLEHNQALRAALPDALAVEMEGAALAQVCHDLQVPFAVVRTISDRADADAHVDFAHFVAEVASRHSLAIVREVLARLA